MVGPAVFAHGGQTGRDDEELGGDKVKLGGEGEEAGIEGRLGLSLLEGFAVVEIRMGEDPAKAASERREMAVRAVRDGETVCYVLVAVHEVHIYMNGVTVKETREGSSAAR